MDNIKVVHLPIENFDPEKALESLEIHEKLDEEISESFSEIPFDSSRLGTKFLTSKINNYL